MRLAGTTALVTGAAGGLGQAICRELSSRGVTVTVSGRNRAALERLANEIAGAVLVCDLTDADAVRDLAARVGEWDIVVANAGIGGDGPIATLDEQQIDSVLSVNLRTPIVLTTAFIQQRQDRSEPGHVVLIGSLSGLVATPETRMYNATKFGLRGFGLSVRQDLLGTPLSVSVVAPGFIRDAGMFHDGGMTLPPGVRTCSPQEVALGVVEAIEKDRAEVFVAPIELRLASTLGGTAPGLSERLQQRLGVADRKRRTDRHV